MSLFLFFFFNDTATTEIYTLSLHDALPISRKKGSIGRPMMFTEVRLLDDDAREVAGGDVGEMYIRGPHVSSGYWHNEAETAAAYSGGWFKTGDLARRDDDGFFYVAGRRKDM